MPRDTPAAISTWSSEISRDAGHTAGDRVGDYTLTGELGSGAFGDVWRATGVDAERPVAIKLLRKQQGWARQRFQREVSALAQLQHPGCVRLLDSGMLPDGRPYLVTEYVDGVLLSDWSGRARTPQTVLSVAAQIADAIAHAHQRGVLHRDLKPTNIIVQPRDAGPPDVRVLDFGIAKMSGRQTQDITKTGEVIGTPGYMSPEQLRGSRDVGPQTDVYALGALLFELLEHRPPFAGEGGLEIAMMHLTHPPPALGPTFSEDLRRLVRDMLAKNPSDRPSMQTVQSVLGGAAYEAPTLHVAAEVQTAPRPRAATAGWRPFAVAVVVFAVALAALLLLRPWASDDTDGSDRTTGERPHVGALLKHSSPDGEKAADVAADAATDQADTATDAGSRADLSPCGQGEPFQPGVRWLTVPGGEMPFYLPAGYDGATRRPVLLLFHDIAQPASHMLSIDGLRAASDQRGFVMAAPSHPNPQDTWNEEIDYQAAERALNTLIASVCVDPDRIFIIGHGNGGLAAERLGCRLDGVRAIAQTSHRFWGSHDACSNPVARITVAALNDPAAPPDGSKACGGLGDVVDSVFGTNTEESTNPWSIEQQEARIRDLHRCKGKNGIFARDGGTCWTADCDPEAVWCRSRGGRDWSSMPTRPATILPFCPSDPSEFDHVTHILRFFDQVGGLRANPTPPPQ